MFAAPVAKPPAKTTQNGPSRTELQQRSGLFKRPVDRRGQAECCEHSSPTMTWNFSGIPASAPDRTVSTPLSSSLQISSGSGGLEREADRAALAVMGGGKAPALSQAPAHVQNRGDHLPSAELTGGGQPLPGQLRSYFAPKFGHSFEDVRVHTDATAAMAAGSLDARAFTVGRNVYFGAGQFDTRSFDGMGLIAHELAHVAQNRSTPAGAATLIQRETWGQQASKWYDDKKWTVYRGIIAALKTAKNSQIGLMRRGIPMMSAGMQGAASTIVNVADFVLDMIIALLLAIIGLAVGFAEGIVGMIEGIIKLAYGLLKMFVDVIANLLGQPDALSKDVDDLVAAINNIPKGLKTLFDNWLDRYKHATLEEQVLMGGELVGQIEAFIATFAFAGTKAGQVPKLAIPAAMEVRTIVTTTGKLAKVPVVTATASVNVAAPAAAGALAAPILMSAAAAVGGGGPGGGGGGKTAAGKDPGVEVELTKKQAERLQRVSEALKDDTKWGDVSANDRFRLGRVYDKVVEKLVTAVMADTATTLHYVEVTTDLIKSLRARGGTVLITEGRLPKLGLRFDLLKISFAKNEAELVDLAATPKASHFAKTLDYKKALEQTLEMPVNAKEMFYTGKDGKLLEPLVEVEVK
jgi:hypothetical protein